jgi:N-acetylglutamate synthase-like GNAT family acetyltransferase
MPTSKVELLCAAQFDSADSSSDDELVDAAAQLLHRQWPKGGSVPEYRAKLVGETCCDSPRQRLLPQSYLMVAGGSDPIGCCDGRTNSSTGRNCQFLGHGRLTECMDGATMAVAATYIVVETQRKGYGRKLMELLEQEAVKLGYHYMYLWTTTAVEFYHKLGYVCTERISLSSACLKYLEVEQVSRIEDVLAKRIGTRKRETVLLPPGDQQECGTKDVWMRKRLVECVRSVRAMPIGERIAELRTAIQRHQQRTNTTLRAWEYVLVPIPWQRQIGPSCGLAALRMLRDFRSDEKTADGPQQQHQQLMSSNTAPSLLREAQNRGFSSDGEIFDATNLVVLAQEVCGLEMSLCHADDIDPLHVAAALQAGTMFIVPYDSQATTRLPCLNSGRSAHYGIIVGIAFGCDCAGRDSDDDALTLCQISGRKDLATADSVLLMVQHGLSSKLAISSWSDFMQSNGQLTEIDTTKHRDSPPAGLDLKQRILICKRRLGQQNSTKYQ